MKARAEAEERKRQIEERIDEEVAQRLLAAVKAKHDGVLGVVELIYLADAALQDIPEEADAIWELFGMKAPPGWKLDKALEKLSSKDLPKFIAAGIVATGHFSGYGKEQDAAAVVLKRLKIDPKAIEKEARDAIVKGDAKNTTKPKGRK